MKPLVDVLLLLILLLACLTVGLEWLSSANNLLNFWGLFMSTCTIGYGCALVVHYWRKRV
jgi:hypothetical protein